MFANDMSIFSDKFVIEDLIYVPIGQYVPMFNRPYTVNVSHSAINTIVNRLDENSTSKVTPNIINGLTDQILQPSAIPFATSIDNGWITTKKFIFMLKVSTVDQLGVTTYSYIQGYTEYDGITNNGTVDPALLHTINNVIETTAIMYNSPTGMIRREKLHKIYNVFTNGSDSMLFTQRPKDVFNNINSINMFNMMDGHNSNLELINNHYTINPFDQKTVGSSVENNITTEYLSKILNTGIMVNKEKDIHVNSFAIEAMETPHDRILEASLGDNRFFKYLSRLNGSVSVLNKFRFQNLLGVDPSIIDRFKLLNITKNFINPVMQNTPETGEYWHGQDMMTVKAYSLIESSVAMAVKYGFSKLYFIVSNMSNPMGQIEIFITNFNSFINLEETEFTAILDIFKANFVNEIFLNETNNGIIPTHMEMYVDLLGTSKINFTFAGYPSTWYTIPTFANSSFAPLITTNKESFDNLSLQMSNIIDTISSNNGSKYSNNYY